jgi:hypothetical protein
MEAAAEPDASDKPTESTAGSGGVNGGEEPSIGKGEEDEPEERSGDETPGSEAPGDKAAEEQGEELAVEPGSNLPGASLLRHRGVRCLVPAYPKVHGSRRCLMGLPRGGRFHPLPPF